MTEYVLTVAVRDTAQRCAPDTVLIEAGQSDPRAFAEAVGSIADLLRTFGTAEKVAQAMQGRRLLLPNPKG